MCSGQKISTNNLVIGPLHPITIKRLLFWAGCGADSSSSILVDSVPLQELHYSLHNF